MTNHAVSQLGAVRLLAVAAKTPAHVDMRDRLSNLHMGNIAVTALTVQTSGDDVHPVTADGARIAGLVFLVGLWTAGASGAAEGS